jgi:hypothetical protein
MPFTAGSRWCIKYDEKREYAYQAGAEESLADARQHGWTIVSIASDWRTVFDD